MATASKYDPWHDQDLEFTLEELQAYRPEDWASKRVNELCQLHRIIERRLQLGQPMKKFWEDVQRYTLARATWYSRSLSVPGVDWDALHTLPDPTSQEGKALTVKAQTYLMDYEGTEGWVDNYEAQAIGNLVYVVSIGRACALKKPSIDWNGWSKNDKSMSNKLAHSVDLERITAEKLRKELLSITSNNKSAV